VELGPGRHLLGGDRGDYFYGASESWLDFLRRQLASVGTTHEMPESLKPIPQIGLLASQWEIARETGNPGAAKLRHRLWSRIPDSILLDGGVDWLLWPGRNPISDQP